MSEQELDRYWKTVVNTIQDGIMIVSTRGTIVSVNRAFEKMTGYNQDELLGRECGILECNACNGKDCPMASHGVICSVLGNWARENAPSAPEMAGSFMWCRMHRS